MNLQDEIDKRMKVILQEQAAAEEEADSTAQGPSAFEETWREVNDLLFPFGAELPPLEEMAEVAPIAGNLTLRGPGGWAIYVEDDDEEGIPGVAICTFRGRIFHIYTKADLVAALEAIAEEGAPEHKYRQAIRIMEALASLRPAFPSDIDGIYGPLLIQFRNDQRPGATFFTTDPMGNMVEVRTRSYFFLHQLTAVNCVAETADMPYQHVRWERSTVRMLNTNSGRGAAVTIGIEDQARLRIAIGRYISWHNLLLEWNQLVIARGFKVSAVEEV